MNKWGIGLSILNLLVAAGLAYYALEVRAKHREVQNAVARHYLALNGLPVDGAKIDGDDVDIRISTANGVPINGISLKTLETYLGAAPGGNQYGASGSPVPTQLAEVNRVVQQVNNAVGAMQTPKEKLTLLAGSFANLPNNRRSFTPGILTYLAGDAGEREAARALALIPNGQNAITAAALFAAKVTEVTTPVADAVWRDRIAHFLMSIDPGSDDWQKRVAHVVGLRTYVNALADQDLAFQEIASRVTRRIEDDQAAFVSQYRQLQELSTQRSLLLSREEEIRAELDRQQQKDGELLNTKQTQKAKAAKAHDDLVAEVAAQSSANATLESAIHSSQKTAGRLLDELLKLEASLDAAELQRKGR